MMLVSGLVVYLRQVQGLHCLWCAPKTCLPVLACPCPVVAAIWSSLPALCGYEPTFECTPELQCGATSDYLSAAILAQTTTVSLHHTNNPFVTLVFDSELPFRFIE
eukprot:scaffold95705_cov22-Tisochrysis_lutea.AAC.1